MRDGQRRNAISQIHIACMGYELQHVWLLRYNRREDRVKLAVRLQCEGLHCYSPRARSRAESGDERRVCRIGRVEQGGDNGSLRDYFELEFNSLECYVFIQ